MTFIMIVFWFATLPVLLRVALRLRLTVPLLYTVAVSTVFRTWYLAHTALADGILFALAALAAAFWVVTAVGKAAGALRQIREERAAIKLLSATVRQARDKDGYAVSVPLLY